MKARSVCVVGDIAMVPLTKGEYAFVDAEKAHMVSGRNWHLVTAKGKFYAATVTPTDGNRGAKTYLHRFVCQADEGFEVDHINNNGLDNRLDNLRLVSKIQNKQNRSVQKNNKTGVSGVTWVKSKRRWRSEINHNNKRRQLGLFKSKDEAVESVIIAKAQVFEMANMPT